MSLRSRLRHSSVGRDAALDRLRRVNRSVIAASVALTAIFADTAANTFAGGTTRAKHVATAHRRTGRHQATHGHTATTPLTPPREAPKTTESTHEAAPQAETQQPTEEVAPQSHESAPSKESTPEPTQAEAPAEEHRESTPEPAQEEAPVVSGGS